MGIWWCCRMHRRRIAETVLLAIALLALWGTVYARAESLAAYYTGVSVRIADTPVSEKRLTKRLAQEAADAPACAAAWTRSGQETASSASMHTKSRLRIVSVYGDMRQVAPMTLLSGSFPVDGDYGGCLLDASTAQALFHAADVVGAQVEAGGKRYVVRGVVKAFEPMLLTRGELAAYENLEFRVADLSTGKATVAAFLYQYALTGDHVIVQSGLYAKILSGLVFLPAELALLAVGLRLLLAVWRGRKRPAHALLLLPAAAAFAAMLWLGSRTFFWPQAFLPTKCSDFAFWGTLWEGWRQTWKSIQLTTPLPKEITFFREMRWSVCGLAIILPLEIRVIRNICSLLAARKRINTEVRW